MLGWCRYVADAHAQTTGSAANHLQLLQEIELLVDGAVPSATADGPSPGSALAFTDSKDFQRHLADKGKILKSKTDSILKRLAGARGPVKPEVAELETQVKSLLAQQKELMVKVDRLEAQNASLSEQYDKATLKVIKAERRLDRARSAQVQKLEQQALASSTSHHTSKDENGAGSGTSSAEYDALKLKHQEATAVVEKQKQQLEALLAENKALIEENSTLRIKKETTTDEEYARTELFKQFKQRTEDLIQRINHLEATNKQLREEAEKLRGERTDWKTKLEAEAQVATLELEDQLQQKDSDLTRIRATRDELFAEVTQLRALQEQERKSREQLKELADTQADRIAKLEAELDRLRPSEDTAMMEMDPEIENLGVEELRQRLLKVSREYDDLNNKQLPLLEKSYRKSMALAHSKVMDLHSLEERIAVLTAEKSKADQKYFAVRKDADIRTNEIRALRAQNNKSSEIISQLKDVETQNRALIGNLEKQIAALKQEIATAQSERKRFEHIASDARSQADSCKSRISSLNDLVKTRDADLSKLKEQLLKAETELEKTKADVKEITKDCQRWKLKCQSNSSEEEEALRVSLLARISACRSTANLISESRHLLSVPEQLQEHHSEGVRPRLLQQLCG
jgi:E3 ubiquitin-protein ligase BRE1